MLEKVDLSKKLSKEEYKEKMSHLETRIGQLQRECKALKIPIMIVFEGFGAAGKGLQIGRLIQKKSVCILFSGDSGQKLQKKGELQFMTEAGTEER